jgi:hypothetical protein
MSKQLRSKLNGVGEAEFGESDVFGTRVFAEQHVEEVQHLSHEAAAS